MPQLIEVEKSPNWDKVLDAKIKTQSCTHVAPYPCNEGFPENKQESCFIILRNGRMEIAKPTPFGQILVNYDWELQSGNKVGTPDVAGWLQIIGPAPEERPKNHRTEGMLETL